MAGLGAGRSDPVQGPNDPGERARAAARESAAWLRDEAGRLYDNYTKQSKFFKWRSWIIAAYVFVSLTSVIVWRLKTSNNIKAYVTWHTVTGLSTDSVTIKVENDSANDWIHVRVVLNGAWEFEKDRIAANESAAVPVTQFHKIGSKVKHDNAPPTTHIAKVRVESDQGSFTQDSAD